MRTRIFAKFELYGFHRWDNAPDNRKYLRDSHRHIFKFKVGAMVTHDDRQIEFHDLIQVSRNFVMHTTPGRLQLECDTTIIDFGPASCEQIAARLFNHLQSILPDQIVSVSVSEDGECGAVVERA